MLTARLRSTLCIFVAISLLVAAHGSALAQTPEEKEKAEELFKKGADAYFKEDFSMAIINFKRGFELDPNPLFLYNLSLSFSKLGNLKKALDYAERAREMGGLDKKSSTKNVSRTHSFRSVIKSQDIALRMTGEGPCRVNSDCLEGYVCNMQKNVCTESSGSEEMPPDEPALLDQVTILGWSGAGLALVGTGLVIGAIVIDAGLDDEINRYNDIRDSQPTEAAELKEDIEGQQTTGQILLYSGLGAALAGTGLLVYDLVLSDGSETRTAIFPTIGPDGSATVNVGLRF